MPFEAGKLAREDMKGKAPFTKSDLSPDPIQWVNDSATLMLQYGFGELVGRNVACPGFDPECLGFGGGSPPGGGPTCQREIPRRTVSPPPMSPFLHFAW